VYRSVLSLPEYLLLSSKADYSESSWDFSSAAAERGHRYKAFIERDRVAASHEQAHQQQMGNGGLVCSCL